MKIKDKLLKYMGLVDDHDGRLFRAESRIRKLEKRVGLMAKGLDEEAIEKADQKVKEMGRRLQIKILKECVLSEVVWCARKLDFQDIGDLSIRLSELVANPDDWWEERKEWSINRWLREVQTDEQDAA